MGETEVMNLQSLISRRFEPAAVGFTPTLLADAEISAPLPRRRRDRLADTAHGAAYGAAHVLVTLHGQPLGTVEVELSAEPLEPDVLALRIREQLGPEIAAHLAGDDLTPEALPAFGGLDDGGLRGHVEPPCLTALHRDAADRSVSVVIATYRRPAPLLTCVDSILAGICPPLEVIVVDNAPWDPATANAVRAHYGDDPRVRYLREPRAGASRARNLGLRQARGEVVAFTDDDVVVGPFWVQALAAAFATDDVACATGLTLPAELETPAQAWFEEYGGYNRGYHGRLFDLAEHRGETKLYPYTAGLFGATNNAAFRRSALLELGGFDERLGPGTPAFGAEDLDVFLAVVLSGHRIAYQPRALVRHAHRRGYADLRWQVFTYSAGLTALLTKSALVRPGVAPDLARRVPGLLGAALLRAQRDGAGAAAAYRPELRTLERLGYLYGPVAYLRSRWSPRRG